MDESDVNSKEHDLSKQLLWNIKYKQWAKQTLNVLKTVFVMVFSNIEYLKNMKTWDLQTHRIEEPTEFQEPWDTGVSSVSWCPVMHLLPMNWVLDISCFHTEIIILEDMENHAAQRLFETFPMIHSVGLSAHLNWLSNSPQVKEWTLRNSLKVIQGSKEQIFTSGLSISKEI